MIALFESKNYPQNEKLTAREEAKQRLKFFKHIIEDCDGYKNTAQTQLRKGRVCFSSGC